MTPRIFLLVSVFLMLGIGVFAQSGAAAKPAASADTSKPAAFRPTKDQVMQGQKMLKDAKLYTGDATGVYNNDTRAAIRTWQKNNDIPVTGNFNRATLEKMGIALTDKQKGISTSASASGSAKSSSKSTNKASTKSADGSTVPATASSPKRPAPFQASTDQIKQLQQKLIDAKLFTGTADGKRSDELKTAIAKYQSANGLKSTGGINGATLEKMGITLTDAQKANMAAQAAYDASKPTD